MGEAPPDQSHTIVLSIDGLRASSLGAYGATSYGTPALDRFAAESTLYEWTYADTHDPDDLYRILSDDPLFATPSAQLVTDDRNQPTERFAQRFAKRWLHTAGAPEEPANSIAETALAGVFGEFAEAVAEAASSAAANEPLFAWLHTRGLYGPWDAPVSSYEALIDEEDPPVEPSAAPAVALIDDAEPEAGELRFAAACRYAGQIATLDACLEGLLDVLGGLFEGEPLRVVLFGLRGYPLGEHGQIGGVDQRLFSEQQHAPLLVRTASPADRFGRIGGPSKLSDAVRSILRNEAPEKPDLLTLASDHARVVLTANRLARLSTEEGSAPELYVKPDDRWEQNDIASLEEDVAAALLATPAIESRGEDSA